MSLSARKRRRIWMLVIGAIGLGSATALGLTAFQDNLVFFRSPTDVASQQPPVGRAFRLGGLVEAGSVKRDDSGTRPLITFTVTDGAHQVPVAFRGVLPDLFREGQGVVTLGKLDAGGTFQASEVLARHDETYMPPEVADALKRSGHWDPAKGAPPPANTWNTLPDKATPDGATPESPRS
ncbi:cytochrome c maturation protein CcmE [Acetobacteraceae bacterium H6797]|nr:cytochrome c maturation protein CcmE [Acetobacteraceae bacterium H6797]